MKNVYVNDGTLEELKEALRKDGCHDIEFCNGAYTYYWIENNGFRCTSDNPVIAANSHIIISIKGLREPKEPTEEERETYKRLTSTYTEAQLTAPKRSYCREDAMNSCGFWTMGLSIATKQQRDAAKAQSELTHHMAIWNDGWVADWEDGDQPKWCIEFRLGILTYRLRHTVRCFLAFEHEYTLEAFLELPYLKNLIEQYKPLA